MKKIFFAFILLLAVSFSLTSYKITIKKSRIKQDPPFVNNRNAWTDSIFSQMTLEEKIGQLFMIDVYPSLGFEHWKRVGDLIEKYHIGGIIVFKGTPTQTAQMINYLQSRSKIPLMVAIDAEWGLSMRLDSTIKFPYQLTLGAIQDNSLIEQMGEEIGKELKRIGIHINFAPVADINNNPLNPVIGIRSFGEDKNNVSNKALAYMFGLQSENILAVGKHFPGHGDTDIDSHKDLPVINNSKQRLDSLEFVPFKKLINNGIGGIMTAHLYLPQIIKQKNLPSTLSPIIIDSILKKELKFRGLIFTDALTMKGVTKYYTPGKLEVYAFKAGNDILLMSENLQSAFENLKKGFETSELSKFQLDRKVLKILNAKYWFGLNKYKKIDLNHLTEDLNNDDAKFLNRKLYENAITIVKNEDSLLPVKNLETKKIAVVSIDEKNYNTFIDYCRRYADIDYFTISKNASWESFAQLLQKLKNYNLVILSIHNIKPFAVKTFGITYNTIRFTEALANSNNVILNILGSPYSLRRFKNLQKVKSIVISYEDNELTQELSAQVIFGGIKAKGKLPVSVLNFRVNTGIFTEKIRLKYSVPEELNLNKKKLNEIDTLIEYYIAKGDFPGCQVMAVKDGIVFFQKSYGYFTYDEIYQVQWYHLYDIASVTKIMATVPALMKLYEQNKFDPNKYLGYYLPELKGTNKYYLRIKDVLTHQARLKRWIAFYWETIDWRSGLPKKYYYNYKKTDLYSVEVARNMYLRNDYEQEIYKKIYASPLYRYRRYRYSDLGFYILKKIIEEETGKKLDEYVLENFYIPLGAWSVKYNPLHYFPLEMIVPTEIDNKFRHQLVHGYVHDFGAALLGGVGGHAGLFANANDIAKYLQMLLNGGTYGGKRFFNEQTIKYFTTKPYSYNRRALGFDSTDGRGAGPACSLASAKSFGHTGFTGCMVWADPEYDFIYIFLSNRVYPTSNNRQIIKDNVRAKIQRLFYESFLNPL